MVPGFTGPEMAHVGAAFRASPLSTTSHFRLIWIDHNRRMSRTVLSRIVWTALVLAAVIVGLWAAQNVFASPEDHDLGPVVVNTHEPLPTPSPEPEESPTPTEPTPATSEPTPVEPAPVQPAPPVSVDDDWDDNEEWDDDGWDDDWDDDDWDDDDDDWDDDDWDDDDDD